MYAWFTDILGNTDPIYLNVHNRDEAISVFDNREETVNIVVTTCPTCACEAVIGERDGRELQVVAPILHRLHQPPSTRIADAVVYTQYTSTNAW
jgi:hypothetical protein